MTGTALPPIQTQSEKRVQSLAPGSSQANAGLLEMTTSWKKQDIAFL